MSTMKDVAKLAGVSHGTVSNILNGARGVSAEKVQRVEEAMKALGYLPNTFARGLKTNKTMQIGVILPNILDYSMAQIYTNLSLFAHNDKYQVELNITNEIAEAETDLINRALMSRKDGIILMTCQPGNTEFFETILASGMKVVFLQRKIDKLDHNFVGFDMFPVVRETLQNLIAKGNKKIAIIAGPLEYSSEAKCVLAYRTSLSLNEIQTNESFIEVTNGDRESAFKAAVRLLSLPDAPEIIFTTNELLSDGASKAIELLSCNHEMQIKVATLVSNRWSQRKDGANYYTPLPYARLAETAFELLLENLDTPVFGDAKTVLVNPGTLLTEHETVLGGDNNNTNQGTLRVVLLESEASYATRSLLTDFENATGIKVEIEEKKYEDLYEFIKQNSSNDKYDVFQIDIPWLNEFAQSGIIENLEKFCDKDNSYIKDVIPKILNDFSLYDENLYALPYMYCAQLLYYRKDLFENVKNQRMFFEQYKTELQPPKTWNEFNAVAKFFTRAFNPNSDTEYGTTLGSRFASGAVCEFLPRLWYFGGAVFNDEKIVIDSRQAIKALNSYAESFAYASENSVDNWWDEQVKEFCEGKAAMMVLFNAHATDISDRSKSKVVGKIGFDYLPGKISLLGGWSLGISSRSKKKEEAYRFINWSCSNNISIPNAILGGCPACNDIYENTEIATIYPWHRKAFDAFEYTKKRYIPQRTDGKHFSEHEFELILGDAVYKTVTKQLDAKTALTIAAQRLRELVD